VNGKTEAVPFPVGVRQVNPKAFLRDRNGGLWIGTDVGLLHIHQGRTDLFARGDGLSGDGVASLLEDREGNIWVTTSGGLDRFREFAATTISVPQGLSNNTVIRVLGARDGSVWVATVDGLTRWKDGQATVYRKRGSGLPDDDVESVFQDEGGRIWAFTLHGQPTWRMAGLLRLAGSLADTLVPPLRILTGVFGWRTIKGCFMWLIGGWSS
jgi:ligand-binding sensor domain-containing protein